MCTVLPWQLAKNPLTKRMQVTFGLINSGLMFFRWPDTVTPASLICVAYSLVFEKLNSQVFLLWIYWFRSLWPPLFNLVTPLLQAQPQRVLELWHMEVGEQKHSVFHSLLVPAPQFLSCLLDLSRQHSSREHLVFSSSSDAGQKVESDSKQSPHLTPTHRQYGVRGLGWTMSAKYRIQEA